MAQTITVQQLELCSVTLQDIIDTNINQHKISDESCNLNAFADYLTHLDHMQSVACLCVSYISDKLLA